MNKHRKRKKDLVQTRDIVRLKQDVRVWEREMRRLRYIAIARAASVALPSDFENLDE